MKKLFQIRTLLVLAALALFATACGAQAVQAQSADQVQPVEQAVPKTAAYEAVLGKSLNDKDVADFITSNHCSSISQFQVCNSIGMSFWTGQSQKVETVYLYPNKIQGLEAYKGKLPFGILPGDTMAVVQGKLGQPKFDHAPQAGWEPGLPDAGLTTDYIHYWAIYNRFGVTIVYNSPSATDNGATIYAILVSK